MDASTKKAATAESDAESPLTLGMVEKRLTVNETQLDDKDWDSTKYDERILTSWAALLAWRGCAFSNYSIWESMGVALFVTVVTGVVASIMPDAILVVLDPEQIVQFGSFLTGFAGMLLGFFIASSMNRWYFCVEQFLSLLEAVRNLQMQMAALGVRKDRSETVTRFGLLSVWLLHLRLNLDSDDYHEGRANISSKDLEALKRDKVWKQLDVVRPDLVKAEEKELLYPHSECYGLVWTMIASLVGRMAEDGEIPPMASPTFLKVLKIIEQAYNSIREVRALSVVKPPFIYIHTLAILVHMNNLILSFSFGLSFGSSLNSWIYANHDATTIAKSIFHCVFHYCYSALPSLLYLAMIEVAVAVSQPFDHHDGRFPATTFIKNMERDLNSASIIADNPPFWEKPCFQTTQ